MACLRVGIGLCLLLEIGGCSKIAAGDGVATDSTRAGAIAQTLGTRAAVVAAADALVVHAQSRPSERAKLLRQAAQLRVGIWRLEGRKVDALEALEQFAEIASAGGGSACEARVDQVLLETELNAGLGHAYEALYHLTTESKDRACVSRANAILHVLEAYQPTADSRNRTAVSALVDTPVPADSQKLDAETSRALVVKPALSASAGAEATITGIERYGALESARIVVHLTGPAGFEVGEVAPEAGKGPRIFVDVESAGYRGQSAFDVGGLVERVRLGRRPNGTRIVLDLDTAAYRRVFYLPEPFRLVIDLSKDAPGGESTNTGSRRIRRVALDPGHGGHDPGATGPGGLREKDVTLDIAHRAAPLIAQELGVSTLLTRDADVYVALDERTAKANAFGADLFVSIHCNASVDPAARGVTTFVLDDSRDPLAAHVAARENAASPAAAAELAGALGRVMGGRSLAESLHLAALLQRATVASLGPHYSGVRDQGAKRAGFYVLAGAHMPAALFEVSFISNDVEEARLNIADYRQKLADAIVNAVRAYRDGL